jgi:uncharacterized protein DUF6580
VTLNRTGRVRRILVQATLLVVLIALAVGSRLVKDFCTWLPPNFHAVAGTALFAGFLFRGRATALIVPFAAMWLSDLVLGGYDRIVMTAVYGSLAAPVLLGGWLDRRLSAWKVAGASIGSSLLFFVVTNLAVWCAWYPHDVAGIVRCFARAIPFFVYTLSGDLIFASGLFGLYWLATSDARQRAEAFGRSAAQPLVAQS